MFATVPLDKLLRGGEAGCGARQFASVAEDPLIPSTPIGASPHALLLQEYARDGEAVFHHDRITKTPYYQNAFKIVDAIGPYFDAENPGEIERVMRRFVEDHQRLSGRRQRIPFASAPGSLPIVRPIAGSDCYEIVDGHHRLARAFVAGETTARVRVKGRPTRTPAQDLLAEVLWQGGRRELYQPVPFPEVQNLPLVRRCTDRFEMIERFLRSEGIAPTPDKRYLDIGSSYGWFVASMRDLGFDANGVERDPVAAKVGQWAYGLAREDVTRSEAVRYLRGCGRYDITSCFSVLHHFVLGRGGGVSAEELIKLIDDVTGKVLFFDTGEGHERWFSHTLGTMPGGWSAAHVEQWLRDNTSFSRVERLGVDQDAVPPFEAQYSRTLFACVR
jgi:hypothetical protein